jgi:hypothetical protein
MGTQIRLLSPFSRGHEGGSLLSRWLLQTVLAEQEPSERRFRVMKSGDLGVPQRQWHLLHLTVASTNLAPADTASFSSSSAGRGRAAMLPCVCPCRSLSHSRASTTSSRRPAEEASAGRASRLPPPRPPPADPTSAPRLRSQAGPLEIHRRCLLEIPYRKASSAAPPHLRWSSSCCLCAA